MIMFHPGLPSQYIGFIIFAAVLLVIHALAASQRPNASTFKYAFSRLITSAHIKSMISKRPLLNLFLKWLFALIFLLIIWSGLWGTPVPEKNLATTITWNLWWTLIIITVLFSGSFWCSVCPWDTLATLLVKHRFYRRSKTAFSLQMNPPKWFKSIWPACFLLTFFTWLELGYGLANSPSKTALLAMAMLIMATLFLAFYEGKVFCRTVCPVGRTLGVYSQLAPVALRPINTQICANCEGLECYHGTPTIEPCPTKLVMGKLVENTYCLSCSDCVRSCPSHNVGWHLRSLSSELVQFARPRFDESFFLVLLFAITLFHGFSMLDIWQKIKLDTISLLGELGRPIISFSLLLLVFIGLVFLTYAIFVVLSLAFCGKYDRKNFRQSLLDFSFACLPLSFAYHLAHNLSHLTKESTSWVDIFSNPLGVNEYSLTMMEKHLRFREAWFSNEVLFTLQTAILIFGFYLALKVIRYRGQRLLNTSRWSKLPMIAFVSFALAFCVWMLAQSMIMRM